jgi:HCOMODA/2-hydroxy-3-carboxy-muconic semialdehyde decarboxylase
MGDVMSREPTGEACRREPSDAFHAVAQDPVAANRILAGLGVLDGFGHVSARHPDCPERYLLSRYRPPELVSLDDIMTFDLWSRPADDDERRPCLERFIHGRMYAARPDGTSLGIMEGDVRPRFGVIEGPLHPRRAGPG